MSRENLEKMRESLAAFDRRDRRAWVARRHQNSEVVPSDTWPEADVIRGSEAAWDFYVGVIEAFQVTALGHAELVDAGADNVLVHQRNEVRGRTSGAGVELDYWVVVTFRDGKILRDEWFATRAEALEAVGRSESGDEAVPRPQTGGPTRFHADG